MNELVFQGISTQTRCAESKYAPNLGLTLSLKIVCTTVGLTSELNLSTIGELVNIISAVSVLYAQNPKLTNPRSQPTKIGIFFYLFF